MIVAKSKRLDYISWIQFIGVLSVIFGHSMNSLDVPDGFREVKAWVYTYHMPLFFLVSAYLFAYTGGFGHKGGIKKTLGSKFGRLLVPYLIWNIAFIAPKILMLDKLPNQEAEINGMFFLDCLFYPRNNVLGHTWFLCALFEMFIIAIAFEKLRAKKELWLPITCLLVVLNCFGVSERFLAVGDLMKNGIFFWVGLLLGSVTKEDIIRWSTNNALFSAMAFLIILGTAIWAFDHLFYVNTLVLGMSIILMLGILQIRYGFHNRFIEFVSINSFAIYIMHWPIQIIIRYVVYQKMGVHPILSMVIMFLGAILCATVFVFFLRKLKNPVARKCCKYVFGM